MELGADILAVLIAIFMTGSAFGKLTRQRTVVENLDKADVPHALYPVLAAVQIIGSAGLVWGLQDDQHTIGLLAACGFVAYFLLAVGAHLKAGDSRGIGLPLGLAVVAVVAAVLRAGS